MTVEGKGKLIVLSSPSGGGKTTVCSEVLKAMPDKAVRAVTATTRKPRPGEVNGRDYFFKSREEFEKLRDAGGFLEWAEVHGNLYGTPKDEVEQLRVTGKHVVLVIDVQGAASIKKIEPGAMTIFLLPPGDGVGEKIEVLADRLMQRNTESKEDFVKRQEDAKKELARSDEFDYQVVNDHLGNAVFDVVEIIKTGKNPDIHGKLNPE